METIDFAGLWWLSKGRCWRKKRGVCVLYVTWGGDYEPILTNDMGVVEQSHDTLGGATCWG